MCFARRAPGPWKEPGHSVVNVNNDKCEQLDVENRSGGTGSSTDQRVDNRVGGEGGSENHGNTRVGGNGGIHDRGDQSQAEGERGQCEPAG